MEVFSIDNKIKYSSYFLKDINGDYIEPGNIVIASKDEQRLMNFNDKLNLDEYHYPIEVKNQDGEVIIRKLFKNHLNSIRIQIPEYCFDYGDKEKIKTFLYGITIDPFIFCSNAFGHVGFSNDFDKYVKITKERFKNIEVSLSKEIIDKSDRSLLITEVKDAFDLSEKTFEKFLETGMFHIGETRYFKQMMKKKRGIDYRSNWIAKTGDLPSIFFYYKKPNEKRRLLMKDKYFPWAINCDFVEIIIKRQKDDNIEEKIKWS